MSVPSSAIRYQRATITSADDIRATADAAGSYFFRPDTMRSFSSRLLSSVFPVEGWKAVEGHRYLFVTSERYGDDPRHYQVRMMTLSSRDGRPYVEIDSDFDAQYATAAAAKRAARDRAAAMRAEL